MLILGISAYYHDSAAALIRDGEILAAVQEERFTRKRHDPDFPVHAIKSCLDHAKCTLEDVDEVIFYDKPFLKFERLLETYCAFAPKGLPSFLHSMPVWLRQKLFLKRAIAKGLAEVDPGNKKKFNLLFSEHHLSHAASAFFPSPFEEAAILTVDGVGEWATATIGKGKGSSITVLKELHFPHSVGLLYSAFTYYCGFKVNSGEYKLMGLAPYGDANGHLYRQYLDIIRTKLVKINEDGSIFMDQRYFNYATGLRMVSDRKWKALFGFERRRSEAAVEQRHCDLALAIQTVVEEIMLKMAREARRLTGCSRLVLAGGVALNAVANGKLHGSGIFDEVFIQPASGDAGGALGAALAAYFIRFGAVREAGRTDRLKGSLLGGEFSDPEIGRALQERRAVFRFCADEATLMEQTAKWIAAGNIVGWFQGRMEFGPRALGSRSIVADPRDPGMQSKLNQRIKYREGFRPFAPAILLEAVSDYFEMAGPSPYMLIVKPVKEERRTQMPEGYAAMDMWSKLNIRRSEIPAVTHVDFSARIQTVDGESNERFRKLIAAFGDITGCPVLVNTSFNVRGEPIVNSPDDAYNCFISTEMDYLVIGNYLLAKTEQPAVESRRPVEIIDPD